MTDKPQQTGAGRAKTMDPRDVFVDIKVAHNTGGEGKTARTLLRVKTNAPLKNPQLASLISKDLTNAVLVPDNATKLSDSIKKHVEECMRERDVGEEVLKSRKFEFQILDGRVSLPAPERCEEE